MILIQTSKPATYQIDDQLMVVVFQQYLKNVRLNEPRMYKIVGKLKTYIFDTESMYEDWETPYIFIQEEIYNCSDLQVLITLADFLNKPQS